MPKQYKVLLSAYACEPNKGSEPGVGWYWALEVSKRGHNVCVLTRKNNKNVIESYFKTNPKPHNLEFLYYDLPDIIYKQKKRLGVHLYYLLWQLGILKLVKKQHKIKNFDFVHHITFVTIHQPSFLFLLKGVPFFYGPSAGGDLVPKNFLKSFPPKKRLKENLRYYQNKLLVFDPIRRWMFGKVDLMFCNTEQTKSFLPKNVMPKTTLNLAIGMELNKEENVISKQKESFNVLYAGNLLYLKGIHIGIKAFNKALKNTLSKFTIIGEGNRDEFRAYAPSNKNIEFIDRIPQKELLELYQTYSIFLFPSYRDSGGMVVLEALAKGLPVICLDLGGPGQIVDETCGRVISTKGKSEEDLIEDISNAIKELKNDPELLKRLSIAATKRVKQFSWQNTVDNVYNQIENFMEKSNNEKV